MSLSPRVTRFAGAALLLSVSAALVWGRDKGRISADKLLQDVRYLASPALGGRGSGSPGLTKAAEYIAGQFSRAGLKPMGANGGYFQSFPIATEARVSGPNTLTWTVSGGGGGEPHAVAEGDLEPAAFSASGTVRGRVVFAGYGATACEYGYDDYAGVDVRGKIVVILRHEPQEYENSRAFEGRIYSEHSQIFRKLLTAKQRGAAAVLLVNDTVNHSGPDVPEKLTSLPSPGGAGIPFAGLRASVLEQWFREAGKDFAATQARIDKTLEPQSFEFSADIQLELQISVQAETRMISNVVGYLPGETDEYLIIGAHYDHLGTGQQYSLASNQTGTVHPGADDNASGSAAVLALARHFSSLPKMRRGILFVTFAGEEIGLLGSTWITQHPVMPIRNATAMINMDMIGRMRDHSLIVGGVTSGEGMRARVEAVAKHFPFELQMGGQAVYGSSDHTAFTSHQIPVLFFFTGLHADYHRPSDTPDKIDSRNTALIADLVAGVATSLATTPDRPAFHIPEGMKRCGEQKFSLARPQRADKVW